MSAENFPDDKCDVKPRLSVVVCTYNRVGLLADCLESLVDQTLSHDQFEIIVVDNNSSDETGKIVLAWQNRCPFIHYVLETRQGVSYARNTGWRRAQGEFVAYIDDDTVATAGWCEKILQAFTTIKPQPSAVGGVILPRLDKRPPWWFSPKLEIRTWGESAGFLDSPAAHFGFSGANMACPRQILDDFEGFNPRFGMSGGRVWLGEEPDLFMRIYKDHPYFWYDPEIKVSHYVPDAQLQLHGRLYRAFQSGRTRRQLEKKSVALRLLLSEIGGVFHLFRLRCSEQPFELMYVILSVLERISDRLGYFTGRTR